MRKDTVEDSDDSESQEPTKKACDGCFRLKRACDKRQPCAQCKSRVVPCTYTREPKQKTSASEKTVQGESVSAEASSSRPQYQQVTHPAIGESSHPVKSTGYPIGASVLQQHQPDDDTITTYRSSIPDTSHSVAPMGASSTITSGSFQIEHPEMDSTLGFLAHVTSTSGIISTFECGTDEQRWQILHDEDTIGYRASRNVRTSSTSARSGRSYSSGNLFAPAGQTEQQYWLYANEPTVSSHLGSPGMASSQSFTRAFSTSSSESGVGFPGLEPSSSFGATGPSHTRESWQNLHIACQRIVARMRQAVSTANRSSVIEYSWSPEVERECSAFFSTSNCRKFLRLFFAAWAPNCPIIHKPTFDPSQALESLVAVMVLLDKYLLLYTGSNSSHSTRACTSPDSSHLENAKKWVSGLPLVPGRDRASVHNTSHASAPHWSQSA